MTLLELWILSSTCLPFLFVHYYIPIVNLILVNTFLVLIFSTISEIKGKGWLFLIVHLFRYW